MKKKYYNQYKYLVSDVKAKLPKKIDDNYIKNELLVVTPGKDAYSLERGWFLCGQKVNKINTDGLSKEQFANINFDSNTKFSKAQQVKFKPQELLERGKNFGLGLEKLHKAGIDGTGINVAIIDWAFDIDNDEFLDKEGKSRVVIYDDEKANEKFQNRDGFHGKSVTSLFAGSNTGVAPKAKINYFAINDCPLKNDRQDILEKILDINNSGGEKIEIVSMSSSFQNDEENEKYTNRLKEKGCAFLSSTNFWKHFVYGDRNTYEDLDDPNNINIMEMLKGHSEKICIPCGGRSYPQIRKGYMYCGGGSASWAIPQVAGLYVISKQMDKNITYDEFSDVCVKTCHINKEGIKVINPEGIVREINLNNKAKSENDTEGYSKIYKESSSLIANLDKIVEKSETFSDKLGNAVQETRNIELSIPNKTPIQKDRNERI